jgi:putative membrane protein
MMTKYAKLVLMTLTFLAVSVGIGYGVQTGKTKTMPAGTKKPTATRMSAVDSTFAKNSAQAGMTEIQLGQIAKDKSTNDDVKNFGQKMIDDHTKAGDALKQVATQKSITLPTEVNATQKAEIARLSKLSGKSFDRAYMSQMVKDHTAVVAALKHASQTSKDADIKGWASNTAPTAEEHLKMAKDISKKLSPPAAKKK